MLQLSLSSIINKITICLVLCYIKLKSRNFYIDCLGQESRNYILYSIFTLQFLIYSQDNNIQNLSFLYSINFYKMDRIRGQIWIKLRKIVHRKRQWKYKPYIEEIESMSTRMWKKGNRQSKLA